MCKHAAAVLYAIGARLDQQPELLFRLQKVDERELIATASRELPLGGKAPAPERALGSEDLSAIFGLELAQTTDAPAPPPVRAGKPKKVKKLGKKKSKAAATRKKTKLIGSNKIKGSMA